MTALILTLNGGLMAVMTMVEVLHFRHVRRVTFLTAAHVLIAVAYCLPPFLITWLPGTPWAAGLNGPNNPNPWGIRLYILDLADALRLPPSAPLTVTIILFGAYALLLVGYFLARRVPVRPLMSAAVQPAPLLVAGGTLAVLAAAAFAVYASQFGSVAELIRRGWLIRSGLMEAQRGYLQVLTQIGFPAFLFLAAAAQRWTGWRRVAIAAGAGAVWAVVVLRFLHVGGRLDMGAFLLPPLLAAIFLLPSRRLAVAALAGFGGLALILVNLPHNIFYMPARFLPRVLSAFYDKFLDRLFYLLAEFAFPYVAAAHTLIVAGVVIPYRYFVDIPLGALYMLPNFSGVETLPPMILNLHVELLPWIPVDLFSFGYYSLGTVGVLITFAAFGAVLAVFDGWLTFSTGWLGQAFRAAWLFYLPFRLLYADPYAAAQSGFGLITGTLVLLGLSLWAERRAKPTR